jgi:hypothetical protein
VDGYDVDAFGLVSAESRPGERDGVPGDRRLPPGPLGCGAIFVALLVSVALMIEATLIYRLEVAGGGCGGCLVDQRLLKTWR